MDAIKLAVPADAAVFRVTVVAEIRYAFLAMVVYYCASLELFVVDLSAVTTDHTRLSGLFVFI